MSNDAGGALFLCAQFDGQLWESMNMQVLIRPERPEDLAAVAEVNHQAFGGDGEAVLVGQLHREGYVRHSLVAELAGQVVGHLLFSEMSIVGPGETVPALALAPLAVLPEQQNRGIGTQLVQRGLADLRQSGHRIVIVLGHPPYYRRFGFSSELARPLESPFPREAFMALELAPGALAGVLGRVQYPPPFGV